MVWLLLAAAAWWPRPVGAQDTVAAPETEAVAMRFAAAWAARDFAAVSALLADDVAVVQGNPL